MILDYESKIERNGKLIQNDFDKLEQSSYSPSAEEKDTRALILKHFALGDTTMQKPRVEFNDMSVIGRMQTDQMSFNTYQPNNGESNAGDIINGWRSNAVRPIVRNKCISIAAHATARLIFPKVFAFNKQSQPQRDAERVMEELMEWAADKSNYSYYTLNRVLASLTDPASIGYTEYAEAYRQVKREKKNGKWVVETECDEELSGFQNVPVPADQLYIENFYEPDIQKQGWLIWRRVYSYSLAESRYASLYKNFKYVFPGVQLIYNDANQSFYQVYDTNMRPEDVEEIVYWNRGLDLKIIMVNGVMLTDPQNPNPRLDKKYPFDKFGYELINNRCFYYKSLAFKMQQDANVINTLYSMFIDGSYLNLMPPMINSGGETISSEVIVPGAVTTLSSPDAKLVPISTSNNLIAGINAMQKVEESINQTSQEPIMSGQTPSGFNTAYEISRIEQNANTVLGLFIKMISDFVKQFGKLRLSDIVQYLTLAEVGQITDNGMLVYKTFLNQRNSTENKSSSVVAFTSELPDEPIDEDEHEKLSFETLEEESKFDKMTIYKVNPKLFRELSFQITITPDILNPMSEDLERAFKLEAYDRAIRNPLLDQEAITKDFLLGAYRHLVSKPEDYLKKEMAQEMTMATGTPVGQGKTPLQSMNYLPNVPSV